MYPLLEEDYAYNNTVLISEIIDLDEGNQDDDIDTSIDDNYSMSSDDWMSDTGSICSSEDFELYDEELWHGFLHLNYDWELNFRGNYILESLFNPDRETQALQDLGGDLFADPYYADIESPDFEHMDLGLADENNVHYDIMEPDVFDDIDFCGYEEVAIEYDNDGYALGVVHIMYDETEDSSDESVGPVYKSLSDVVKFDRCDSD